MELYLANNNPHIDHGPELSPAERVHDLSQPQRPPSRGEKTGLGIIPGAFWNRNSNGTPLADDPSKRKRKYWLIGAVVAAVIIIILAIALPVGLTRRGKKTSGTSNGAPSISIAGAYNGTGMALMQLGTSNSDYAYHLYYQHFSGEIRDVYLNNYEWVPAAYTNVGLPASVRNGTPLAVASYASDTESYPTYHIFYIDASGILQETVNANGAGNWNRGSLGNLNVKPSESPSVGLTACSNERWNGANVSINDRVFELYYGDSDNLVHELTYNFGSKSWTSHANFPNTLASAGIACSASNASFSYVFLSNNKDQLELWWKDSNDTAANSAANSTTHPLGTWTKGKTPILLILSFDVLSVQRCLIVLSVQNPAPVTIRPNSSISRIRTGDTTDLIFFIDPSGAVKALQPELSAEDSSWGSLLDIGSAVAGPQSHLATGTMFQGNFSTVPNLTTTEYRANLGFHVFLQEDASNITEYVRSYNQGQWMSGVLPGL
ncbi:hypothetical protein MMC22_005807 [Lobaria immixta]|nr:hypothetical protein [Lobaria immixta]